MAERTKTKRAVDARALPDEWRELIERRLVEGGTFEDAVESVAERGGPPVTLQTVESFYRSNLDLQKRRILSTLKRAQSLKQAIARPESAEAQLLDAALLTGLQGLSRQAARLTVKDAASIRLQKENVKLRHDLLKLRTRKQQKEELYLQARTQHELERTVMLREQVQQLRRLIEKEGSNLAPELMTKIQEIYGLANLTEIPAGSTEEIGTR